MIMHLVRGHDGTFLCNGSRDGTWTYDENKATCIPCLRAEIARLLPNTKLIEKYGKPTCDWVKYDPEDGCPSSCGNERPCPKHDFLHGKAALSCTAPDGSTKSWLFDGNYHKNGKALSPFFDTAAELFEWLYANGWKDVRGTFASEWTKEKGS